MSNAFDQEVMADAHDEWRRRALAAEAEVATWREQSAIDRIHRDSDQEALDDLRAEVMDERAACARAAQDRDISMRRRGELEAEVERWRLASCVGSFRDDCACVECGLHDGDRNRMATDLAARRQRHADDYDVLLAHANEVERDNADLRGLLSAAHGAHGALTDAGTVPVPGTVDQPIADAIRALTAERAALRQRHAEAVEAAFKEGRSSDQRAQDDAAWLASEAKKRLDYTPDGPRIRQIVCEVPKRTDA